MRRPTKRVWFLVAPGTGALNVAGPWEVLGHANDVLERAAYRMEMVGPLAPAIETRHGLVLGGIRALPPGACQLPDLAIVAGASPRLPLPDGQARIAAWLRRHHRRIPTVASICTGAFLLGEAGLLDGRRATTHWLHLARLQTRFPAAQVIDQGSV